MKDSNMSPNMVTLTDQPKERRIRLRKLIISVILVSIAVHVLVGVGAAVWVVARYLTQPRTEFVSKRLKVPAEERRQFLAVDEIVALRPRTAVNNRIQSIRPTKLALPEMPKLPVEVSLPIDVDALISDQVEGFSRSDVGRSGNASGGFFGGAGLATSGLLEGTFYDLKQTPNHEPTEFTTDLPVAQTPLFSMLRKFIQNWNPAPFRKYFQGEDKLYSSQLSIPSIPSPVAPKEFGLDKWVKPGYWIVHYKGRVVAPKTGRFRFVGFGDDALLVRFDRKNVLDAGFWPITRSIDPPVYEYGPGSYLPPGAPKGLIQGETFRVEQGKVYDIEILIGDFGAASGSGRSQASLMIQDMDADYRKFRETGAPLLPFFKMTSSNAEARERQNLPPYDRNAPLWNPSSAAGRPGLQEACRGPA